MSGDTAIALIGGLYAVEWMTVLYAIRQAQAIKIQERRESREGGE